MKLNCDFVSLGWFESRKVFYLCVLFAKRSNSTGNSDILFDFDWPLSPCFLRVDLCWYRVFVRKLLARISRDTSKVYVCVFKIYFI